MMSCWILSLMLKISSRRSCIGHSLIWQKHNGEKSTNQLSQEDLALPTLIWKCTLDCTLHCTVENSQLIRSLWKDLHCPFSFETCPKSSELPWYHNIKLLFVLFFVFLSFCDLVILWFCLFVILSFCVFIWISLWSNVWRVSSLKSHSLCQNSTVALTDWLTDSVTKVR